jgi:type VI secretion system protein ImpC
MPDRPQFGTPDVQFTVGGTASGPPSEETPFRMLVAADLGGRTRPGELRPVRVDRDNFDGLPARLGVSVRLPGMRPDGDDLTLEFAELEDFRPERLRERVRGLVQPPDAHDPPPGRTVSLDELLAATAERAAATPADPTGFGEFLRRVVGPHLAPEDDPRQVQLARDTETAIGGILRAVLHHPRFQAVEAAWRGLALLVKRLDTDIAVHLFVLDATRDELAAADLGALLVRRAEADGVPWAVVVGAYLFDPTAAGADQLRRIGQVTARAGAVFLAGASDAHVGCRSLAVTPDPDQWDSPPNPDGDAAWAALRREPWAAHVGLALPRLLLRLPYGRDADPAAARIAGRGLAVLRPVRGTDRARFASMGSIADPPRPLAGRWR